MQTGCGRGPVGSSTLPVKNGVSRANPTFSPTSDISLA